MVDGRELPLNPEVAAAKGRFNPARGVIVGTNLNEGRLLMPLEQPVDGAPAPSTPQLMKW